MARFNLTLSETITSPAEGSIVKALLYWSGINNAASCVAGNSHQVVWSGPTGSNISISSPDRTYGPAPIPPLAPVARHHCVFVEDVTSLLEVTNQPQEITVSGLSFTGANYGAGVLVYYQDLSGAYNPYSRQIRLLQGLDAVNCSLTPAGHNASVGAEQCFYFQPVQDRNRILEFIVMGGGYSVDTNNNDTVYGNPFTV